MAARAGEVKAPRVKAIGRGVGPIRQRPGMYIGSLGPEGLFHLLFEVVGNAFDQHLAGYAPRLSIAVDRNGWTTVEDDGAGIPVETLVTVMTMFHDRATFDDHHPHVHLRSFTFGIGLIAVNALSARLEVETYRDGHLWSAAFERGELISPLLEGPASSARGTRIRYLPDETIFEEARLDLKAVELRLLELARLAPGIGLQFQGRGLHAPGGLLALAGAPDGEVVETSLLEGHGVADDVEVDFAIAWRRHGTDPLVRSFVNYAETIEGGSHVLGVWRALAATAPTVDVRRACARGMVVVLHVGLLHPRFHGPTKWQLDADAARDAVAKVIEHSLRARPWWWDRIAELMRA